MTNLKRLRMFAGPNGSGKSTLLRMLAKNFSSEGFFTLQNYINADDLLRDLQDGRGIRLAQFGLTLTIESLKNSLIAGKRVDSKHAFIAESEMKDGVLFAPPVACDAYVTASIADIIREELLLAEQSFSFETVMSHRSKVDFFARAHASGYRTYLYFIATDQPSLNNRRVQTRAELGGHAVPEDKIRERYERSLQLVSDALKHATRGFLFDNSGMEPQLLAALKPDGILELKRSKEVMPAWFLTQVAARFDLQ